MKIKVILFFVLIVLFLSGCSSAELPNPVDNSRLYIQMVKEGINTAYPDKPYGKTFESFFASPDWKYFQADTGEEIVEFTGECNYRDVDVKAELQFKLDIENGTFEVGALNLNDVPQDTLITASLLKTVFEDLPDVPADSEVESSASSPPPQLEKSESESTTAKDVVDWLGITTAEVLTEFGTDYTLDSIGGTQILIFEGHPYTYYFEPVEWGSVHGSEAITIVQVYKDAHINEFWHCGMTESEIEEATNAEQLLDRYFSTDEMNGAQYLTLEMVEARYIFTWLDSDPSLPCDLVTVELP